MIEDYYVKDGILYCDEASDGGKSIDTHTIGKCSELVHKPPCCDAWRNKQYVFYITEAHSKIRNFKRCQDCGRPLDND